MQDNQTSKCFGYMSPVIEDYLFISVDIDREVKHKSGIEA